MNTFELVAEQRNVQGKGASRRLRRAGKVPAIVYGAGKEPQNIQLEHEALFVQSQFEAFYSHILTLTVDGRKESVVLKDMQRHPYKPRISHLDLLRVTADEKLTMRVPIHFLNQDKCPGVKLQGGIVSHQMSELEIECLPKDLPEYIAVDLINMNVGDAVHMADLVLPAGVELAALIHGGDASQPVVSVHEPRVSSDEDTAAPVAPENGEGEAT